jgi:quaternary ammonium compound-resistance protein SugE
VNSAVNTAWTYLIAAGLFEIGWLLGLKWAQQAQRTPGLVAGFAIAIVAMGISGFLLYLAQKEISLGTSYAVWTGIGTAGTFLIGVLFFGDPNALGRWLGVALIVAGVATLKLAH